MQPARHGYRDLVVGLLDRIVEDASGGFAAARDTIVDALSTDKIIHVAGSGHSHILAEEVFYRAGGIAAAQAILDPDLMLHHGAERSTVLEREEGRAAAVLASYPVTSGDVLIIASNSGRNAYPIELALDARERGLTTIALTSMKHAHSVSSRHSSGKMLHEVTDLVLDNFGNPGDAALAIPRRSERMGPTSTIAGVFILNALFAEAVEELSARGIEPDIYQSANALEPDTSMSAILGKWRFRIRGL